MKWSEGKPIGSVVSDTPIPDVFGGGDDIAYYGGYLVGESIPASVQLLVAAAPDLLEELQCLIGQAADACGVIQEYLDMPCESLKAKLPRAILRIQGRLNTARLAVARATNSTEKQS